jgi:hypothetical protein
MNDFAGSLIIAWVAALDIGKAEPMCCMRVPDEDRPGRRLQEVQAYSIMTRSLLGLSDPLHCLGVTRVFVPPPIRKLRGLTRCRATWWPPAPRRSSGLRSCLRTPASSSASPSARDPSPGTGASVSLFCKGYPSPASRDLASRASEPRQCSNASLR